MFAMAGMLVRQLFLCTRQVCQVVARVNAMK